MAREKMTEEQFQRATHRYRTADVQQAITDANSYVARGVDCVVVDFGALGYGLMLRRAAVAVLAFDAGLRIVELR